MEFFVYSRAAIERVAPHDVSHWIVSITSRPDDIARIPTNEHTFEIIRLSFLDVGTDEPGAMNDADARAILDAFERHRHHAERVIAHCDAGRSRSPGVALALARLSGGSEDDLLRRYAPNTHVVETILRVAKERQSERR